MDKTDLRNSEVEVAKIDLEPGDSIRNVPSRPMQKGRFLFGMLLSASGLASMLIVAAGALQTAGMNGRLSLPAVAILMVLGLMLLGGGFGIMATSAGTFDDDEFNRLMAETAAEREAGVPESAVTELPGFRDESKAPERTVPSRCEQTVA